MTTPVQNYTYAELLLLVPSYAERKDQAFLDKLSTFVSLAENRLATDMKQQGFQSVVTGTLPTSNVMQKPSFWRETISFSYTDPVTNTPQPILLRSLEFAKAYSAAAPTGTVPRYYADYNSQNFLLAPVLSAGLLFELAYYARLQPLSDANQSNWLTLNAPQALFFAAMLEASTWLKNQAEIAKWEGRYQDARGSLLGENQERLADRNVVVTRA